MKRAVVALAAVAFACEASPIAEPSARAPVVAPPDAAPPLADAGAEADAAPNAGSTVKGLVASPKETSVILAPSGFDRDAFHDVAPSGPKAIGVGNAWTITDVPAGTYLVLAGYEKDGVVLDPTSTPPTIVVSGRPDEVVTVADPQKLVAALPIVTIRPTSTSAQVTVAGAASADAYELSVIDWQGKSVYAATLPGSGSGGNVTLDIAAPLAVPLQYRVRVTAKSEAGATIAQTEELAGVFTATPDDT